MNDLSWAAKVRLVHERALNCCEYCQTCQQIIGQAMHVEHIDPKAGDDLENLALACPSCNQSKAKVTQSTDPDTDEITPFFHPRQQRWSEHFAWVEVGERITGLTPIGRATVERLKMNQERVVVSRKLWIRFGLHPPRLS